MRKPIALFDPDRSPLFRKFVRAKNDGEFAEGDDIPVV
jgi:hypothetical protein